MGCIVAGVLIFSRKTNEDGPLLIWLNKHRPDWSPSNRTEPPPLPSLRELDNIVSEFLINDIKESIEPFVYLKDQIVKFIDRMIKKD